MRKRNIFIIFSPPRRLLGFLFVVIIKEELLQYRLFSISFNFNEEGNTMRFLLIVKATEYYEAGLSDEEEYCEAMIAYRNSLAINSVLLADEELHTSSTGLRIIHPIKDGKPQILAGPFPVTQDLIMKYILINVSTEDEALNWALRMPVPKGRGTYEIELRRLKEKQEFIQAAANAMEASLQEQLNILKNL